MHLRNQSQGQMISQAIVHSPCPTSQTTLFNLASTWPRHNVTAETTIKHMLDSSEAPC